MKQPFLFRIFSAAAFICTTLSFTYCNGTSGNTPDKDSITSASASGNEPAPQKSASKGACRIAAKIGDRVLDQQLPLDCSAGTLTAQHIGEQMHILYDGDEGQPNDVDGFQIRIHKFNGPGTYAFTNNENAMALISVSATESYLTGPLKTDGTVTIDEYKPGRIIKGHFSFSVASNDPVQKVVQVKEGVFSVETDDDGSCCQVQEATPQP
ncbi:DUF6252 family protein [Chitinophaga arvensicola]|uniref:Secreted protein n=1 Tax=Chitinophaga arvensicola TaxID=29529 RepID=A0A1I0R4F0_9BACT|nr:DUF6252 family protein [Chitinophaga arvensicola]SEW34859.1 hypothetical protein SAMN04488122_2157 [Chitinophaga arvensicola]